MALADRLLEVVEDLLIEESGGTAVRHPPICHAALFDLADPGLLDCLRARQRAPVGRGNAVAKECARHQHCSANNSG